MGVLYQINQDQSGILVYSESRTLDIRNCIEKYVFKYTQQ